MKDGWKQMQIDCKIQAMDNYITESKFTYVYNLYNELTEDKSIYNNEYFIDTIENLIGYFWIKKDYTNLLSLYHDFNIRCNIFNEVFMKYAVEDISEIKENFNRPLYYTLMASNKNIEFPTILPIMFKCKDTWETNITFSTNLIFTGKCKDITEYYLNVEGLTSRFITSLLNKNNSDRQLLNIISIANAQVHSLRQEFFRTRKIKNILKTLDELYNININEIIHNAIIPSHDKVYLHLFKENTVPNMVWY